MGMEAKKVDRMLKLLAEVDSMKANGWRWSDMADLVRGQLGCPDMKDGALRGLVHRARLKRSAKLMKVSVS